MSEQEKVAVSPCHGSPVVVVESATKHTSPYRPTESQDIGLPESPQKRSSCVTTISSERHKMAAKKLSSNIKRRDSTSPVTVSTATKETETKMEEIVLMTASAMPKLPSADLPSPIPSTHKEYTKPIVEPPKKVPDDESITPEVAEHTRDSRFKVPYWSPETESGLSRAESRTSHGSRGSRASRMSRIPRVVRQENDSNSNITKEAEDELKLELKDKEADDKEIKEKENRKHEIVEENQVVENKEVAEIKDVEEVKEVASSITTFSEVVEDELDEVAEDSELDEDSEEVEEEQEVVASQVSEEETLAEITLSDRSSLCSLDEKTLPGPCNLSGRPFAGNSDVTISLTKKPGSKASIGHDNFKPIRSGISITLKGSGRNSTYIRPLDLTVATAKISPLRVGQGDVCLTVKEGISHYLSNLKGKLLTLGGKINHALRF